MSEHARRLAHPGAQRADAARAGRPARRRCPTAAMRCGPFPSATWPTPSSCAARSKAWRRGLRPSAARRRWCCARRAPACAASTNCCASRRSTTRPSRAMSPTTRIPRAALEMAGSPVIAQADGARDQPAVRLALGLRAGAGQFAAPPATCSSIAQDQHGQVLDAIESREGSRAEALMREHSRIAQRNLREALHGSPEPIPLPGVQLIRRRADGESPGFQMKSDIHWMPARISALRDLTPTVREFEITPESRPCRRARARRPPAGAGAGRRAGAARCRTAPTRWSARARRPRWRIAVKRLDDGRGGSLAMWRLAVGDRLLVSEPQNHFGST